VFVRLRNAGRPSGAIAKGRLAWRTNLRRRQFPAFRLWPPGRQQAGFLSIAERRVGESKRTLRLIDGLRPSMSLWFVATTGARHGMSLISAITSKGHMRFMITEKGGVNSDVFIEFLKRLLVGAKRAVFLIVDRGPICHHGRAQGQARPWLQRYMGDLPAPGRRTQLQQQIDISLGHVV
jgi:hypothetical protein